MKKKDKTDSLERLVKLTKLLKSTKVSVEIKAPMPLRGPNKWRTYDAKFGPKPKKAENVVEAGGMEVDPALKEEYENWRKDKLAKQTDRRLKYHRQALAKAKARADLEKS